MPLSTNKDTWTEILEYFRVSLSRDNADEIIEKRRIILSIALVCPELVNIALDELWRSLTTLEPITRVFNAPFSSEVFEYQLGDSCWIILPGKITMGLKSRLTCYLSRIKYLHLSGNTSLREHLLWESLFSIGFSPLCPNLRGISITGMVMPSHAYHLTALASSSLQSINFQADVPSSAVASSIILDTLNYRGMRMLDIIYTGYATKNVLSRIFQFSELRSLTIKTTRYQGSHLESSDIQSFGTLEHLTTLDLSLDMFQMTSHVGRWIESMEQLSVLSLHGRWSSVYGCMQDRTFVAVQSLSVILQPSSSNRRQLSTATNSGHLSTIFKAFPSLHSLCLVNEANKNMNDIITPTDIPEVPNESPLRCLELRYMKLALSEGDIIKIMRAWPTLESLSIIPSANKRLSYSASEILSYASHGAPCLHEMTLPLDLSSLNSTSYSRSILSSGKCPLRRLELPWVQDLPQDLKGTLVLARNLVSLFPRLHDVTLLDLESDIRDLRMIIEFLQDAISSPPHRPDGLY